MLSTLKTAAAMEQEFVELVVELPTGTKIAVDVTIKDYKSILKGEYHNAQLYLDIGEKLEHSTLHLYQFSTEENTYAVCLNLHSQNLFVKLVA